MLGSKERPKRSLFNEQKIPEEWLTDISHFIGMPFVVIIINVTCVGVFASLRQCPTKKQ